MSGSRIGQTECLSRRGFLMLCGSSSAALALTAYTRQPPSSPALPVSASPTPTFVHHMFLPVVSKSVLVSPENPPFRTIQGPVSMDELRQSTFDPGWYEIQKEGGTIDIVNHPVFGKAFRFTCTEKRPEDKSNRVYGMKEFPRVQGPVDWDLIFDAQFGIGVMPMDMGSLNLGSTFSKTWPAGDETWQCMMGIDIFSRRPNIAVKKSIEDGTSSTHDHFIKSDRQLKEDVPYRFRLYTRNNIATLEIAEFDMKGNIIEESIWCQGEMHPDFVGVPPVMFHMGLYGWNIPEGAVLYNGNSFLELREPQNG